jgi:PqqA peptide cyclase
MRSQNEVQPAPSTSRKLYELDLHVTNRCNLSCRICAFRSNELLLREFSLEEIALLLTEARELGCQHVHITGGEPTVRSDLEGIVRAAVERNMSVRLQTNGYLLSEDRARALKDLGLGSVMISIDSADDKVNTFSRGPRALEIALRAVDACRKVSIPLRVNAVLHRRTESGFSDLVRVLVDRGVPVISAFYFGPMGRGRQHRSLWLDPATYLNTCASLSRSIERIRRQSGASEVDIIVEPAYVEWDRADRIDTSGFTGCGGGCNTVVAKREYVLVRCDGNVYPCSPCLDWPQCLGNVRRRSLRDIWQDDSGWSVLDRQHLRERCDGCRHWGLCGGGCAAYAATLGGSARGPDPRCIPGRIVPLCPLMKYNFRGDRYGGSSDDVQTR